MDSLKPVMDFAKVIIEKAKLVYLCLVITMTSIVLFYLPDNLVMKLKLYPIREEYSGYINLMALLSCIYLLIIIAKRTYELMIIQWYKYVLNKKIKDKMKNLSTDEKVILGNFINNEGNVDIFAYMDSRNKSVIELQSCGVLEIYIQRGQDNRILNGRTLRLDTPYKLNALARKYFGNLIKQTT